MGKITVEQGMGIPLFIMGIMLITCIIRLAGIYG